MVEAFFLSHGRETPRALVETVSPAVGRGVVLRSDAVWFISRGVVAEELDRGDLVALSISGMPEAGPVGITQRAGARPSEEAQALADALREAARRI
jgi:LysR family transcriptional regulator, pca operon transcriptional activator